MNELRSRDDVAAIVSSVARRHGELASILTELSDERLVLPSLLPDWSRLTIICHLRYGADASLSMTHAVLAGQATSFYSEGRARQRPATLRPRPGERPRDVIGSFAARTAELDALWASLDAPQWGLVANEPAENVDLGPTSLGFLALLRLTEVEVHGSDLDVGASGWSEVFVDSAFPMRVQWLASRRSNHARVDGDVEGTWILRPHDGTPFTVTAGGDGVSVTEGSSMEGDVEIAGSKRELLSFLVGRTGLADLSISGDHTLAAAFKQVFPSP